MMTAKMGERDSREEIMKAFRLFDDDQTGEAARVHLVYPPKTGRMSHGISAALSRWRCNC